MKILQFSKFYPPLHGGIESVAFELTEDLNARGFSTDVLCASSDRSTKIETRPSGYTITRAASLARILSTSISPALILFLLQARSQYDIIHLHMPNPMAALAIWLVRPKAKLVTHWHSDVVHQKRSLRLYEPLQQWVLKRSDAIIATSEPYLLASDALKPFLDKVEVIPLGIKSSPNSNQMTIDKSKAIRAQYDNRKIIFALGRMTGYKGFDTLVDAAQLIEDDAVIVVGGSGALLEAHRARVVNNGLENKIHFIGRIPDEEMASYFEAATLFCLPSNARSEAFGVVLLEAMAAGKPIVATNIPGSGVPWVNQHGVTGLNVPICDGAALAESINSLLINEALAKSMGVAGRKRFCFEFNAETMVDKTVVLYERVLKAQPNG